MRNFVKYIFLFLNILVILGIVVIKIGSIVNPNTFLLPAYSSFFLIPIIVLNFLFVVFWVAFKKWYFLISLSVMIIFYPIVRSGFSFNLDKSKEELKGKKITILSYNTMALAYAKKHTKNSPNPVVKYILDQDADIVCMQEFAYSHSPKRFNKEDMEIFFSKYPYKHFVSKNYSQKVLGVVTFSKYPIVNKQRVNYKSNFNLSIYSDILVRKDTIRVVNNHLESNNITRSDIYKTSDLKNNFDSQKAKILTKKLVKKLSVAYKKRAVQANLVAQVVEKSPYKTICCGDFNDVPSSYVYTKIKGKRLKDVFQDDGMGFGLTFVKSAYRFRIDYILCDDDFVANRFRIGRLKASDHYPIQTELYFKEKK